MYILIESEDIRHLIDRVVAQGDPDIPSDGLENLPVTLERVTEIIDTYLTQDPEFAGEIQELVEDEEVHLAVMNLLHLLRERLMVRGTIQWVKVIDRLGCLAIRFKVGVF